MASYTPTHLLALVLACLGLHAVRHRVLDFVSPLEDEEGPVSLIKPLVAQVLRL
jgi:hypothetical protein